MHARNLAAKLKKQSNYAQTCYHCRINRKNPPATRHRCIPEKFSLNFYRF